MKQSKLIKNGTVVTATDVFSADIFIEDEKIACIGKDLKKNADQVLDAKGSYVIPGGIDPHTHLDFTFMGVRSSDDFFDGTKAALFGGTTTIIDFAIQKPGSSLRQALDEWSQKAEGKAVCDYGFHMAVTDLNPKTRTEIPEMVHEFGIPSFKVFMAYKGSLMVPDLHLFELMIEAKKEGGFVMTHCENGDLIASLISKYLAEGKTSPEYHALSRPPLAEAEATGRALDLAYENQSPLYIVHMSCEDALNRVRQGTLRNQSVWVETCIQYLLLDESLYRSEGPGRNPNHGARYILSPPLRRKKDQDVLWSGIQQNLIQTIATDHCTFCVADKEGTSDFSKVPNGIPGIENRIELLYSEGVVPGKISLQKWVELSSTAAAKIFGLYPSKGTIAVGSDADLVIFDPNFNHVISKDTHHINCGYSVYEGWKVKGKCQTTILRGETAVHHGEFKLQSGFGKYLKRRNHGAKSS